MDSASTTWPRGRLRRANLVVGLLHLLQAGAVIALSNGFSIPVSEAFQEGAPGSTLPARENLFDPSFASLIAIFLGLAAVDHLLVAAPRVNEWYEANLGRGRNNARWMEYSVSASVMIGLIALLTGITDVFALVAILGVNAAMILFGALMERMNPDRTDVDWTPFVFGCIAGAIPWIAVTIAIIGSEAGSGDVPGFVYGIYISLFIFFNCFAVNQVLQYRMVGRWRDYRFGEAVYIGLSLLAKSALAWQVYAGALAS
jgi:Heliorhodopsin